jgi:hypothetical protein
MKLPFNPARTEYSFLINIEIEKKYVARRKVSVEPLLACINVMKKLAKFIASSSFQLFSFPTTSALPALQTIHSVRFGINQTKNAHCISVITL